MDLLSCDLICDHQTVVPNCGNVVVDSCDAAVGAAHRSSSDPEPFKGLG